MASSGDAKVVQSGGIHCIAAISSLVAARFPPIRRLPRPGWLQSTLNRANA
jgi:hypothetical protein